MNKKPWWKWRLVCRKSSGESSKKDHGHDWNACCLWKLLRHCYSSFTCNLNVYAYSFIKYSSTLVYWRDADWTGWQLSRISQVNLQPWSCLICTCTILKVKLRERSIVACLPSSHIIQSEFILYCFNFSFNMLTWPLGGLFLHNWILWLVWNNHCPGRL